MGVHGSAALRARLPAGVARTGLLPIPAELEALLLGLSLKVGAALAQQCRKEAAQLKLFGNKAEKQSTGRTLKRNRVLPT